MRASPGGHSECGLFFTSGLIFTEEAWTWRSSRRSDGNRHRLAHPAVCAHYRDGDHGRLFDVEHARAPLGHLVAEAGSDNGDLDLFAHALVQHGAEDDVGIFV